ncbi:SGNH/GDSL hydrolase family protein [Lelliottia amnigena]|uniref:SGNH/GDSL hydrolase family protein n=1 Tax=Lelliottia amnigena TaxID=61646 RepID=UPI001F3926A0|nr:SGNH/GDSL hydrolase family protein [Lelliottia amnigena]
MNRRNLIKSAAIGALAFPFLSEGTGIARTKQESNDVLLQKVIVDLIDGKKVNIDCYGDSVMWGSNPLDLATQTQNPAPKILEKTLSKFYTGVLRVNNFGGPGTTLKDIIKGSDGKGAELQKRMKNDSRVIYLNYGINDMMHGHDLGAYTNGLKEIVKIANANGKAVVFVTPNIMTPYGFGNFNYSAKMPLYAAAMASVSQELKVMLINQFDSTKEDSQKYPLKSVVVDGAHLSDSNYKQMGYNMSMSLISFETIIDKGVLQFAGVSIGGNRSAKISDGDDFKKLEFDPSNNDTFTFAFKGDGLYEFDVKSDNPSDLKLTVNDINIEPKINGANVRFLFDSVNNDSIRSGLRVMTLTSKAPFTILSIRKVK